MPIELTLHETCPARIIWSFVRKTKDPERHIFLSTTGRPLSAAGVSTIVKKVAKWAGVDCHVSGHSLRIGGATAALAAGMSMANIKALGEWSSDAVLRYLRSVAAAQMGASEQMGFF